MKAGAAWHYEVDRLSRFCEVFFVVTESLKPKYNCKISSMPNHCQLQHFFISTILIFFSQLIVLLSLFFFDPQGHFPLTWLRPDYRSRVSLSTRRCATEACSMPSSGSAKRRASERYILGIEQHVYGSLETTHSVYTDNLWHCRRLFKTRPSACFVGAATPDRLLGVLFITIVTILNSPKNYHQGD